MKDLEISKLLQCLRQKRLSGKLDSVIEVDESSAAERNINRVRAVRNSPLQSDLKAMKKAGVGKSRTR